MIHTPTSKITEQACFCEGGLRCSWKFVAARRYKPVVSKRGTVHTLFSFFRLQGVLPQAVLLGHNKAGVVHVGDYRWSSTHLWWHL